MRKETTFSRMLGMAALILGLGISTAANAYDKLTAIGGSKFDGSSEDVSRLLDTKKGTKWGQSFDPTSEDEGRCTMYIIMKAENAIQPTSYFLYTGNDTGSSPNRNWTAWKIYGANFDSDDQATRGAAGWEEIDSKEDVNLPAKNSSPADFTFSTTLTKSYKYYRIEVLDNKQHGDAYTQMDEFGFGTSAQFEAYLEEQAADPTKPVTYTIIAGDRNNGDGEGLPKLFDNNYSTKWGNGFNKKDKGVLSGGAYFIVQTSRPMAPSYVKLVTGTDSKTWQNRNWSQWQVYAIETDDPSSLKRDSEGWIELDAKENIGTAILPNENSYEVFLNFATPCEKKYKYYKVEIDAIQSGDGYMQMTEFALGDQYTMVLDKQNMVNTANTNVDMTKPFYNVLKTEYADIVKAIGEGTDIEAAYAAYKTALSKATECQKSIEAYGTYTGVVQGVRNHYENHTCIVDPTGKALIGKYLDQNVAPDATFKNGSYPYVIENCLLDNDGIDQEGQYAATLLEMYATDLTDGAILDMTYEGLRQRGGNIGNLVDGTDGSTKWEFGNENMPNWGIFKVTDDQEPIAPTYYDLVTANDNESWNGRNWKDWEIYGGNFENDDQAQENASGWELLDSKRNIGSDQLPDKNFFHVTFNLSNPATKTYKYFKVKVLASQGGGYVQMGDIIFFNDANFRITRNEKYDELKDFLSEVEGSKFYKQLAVDYENTLAQLKIATNGGLVNNSVSRLQQLQDEIYECIAAYDEYLTAYEDASTFDFSEYNTGNTADWATAYFGAETAPTALIPNGSGMYIYNQGTLSLEGIKNEIEYLANMQRAANFSHTTGFVYITGNVVGQWGDGHPKHLVDGVTGEWDGIDNPPTKLGGNIDTTGDTYVIFKTLNRENPFFYTLMTGGDTYSYQDRNPGSWDIYGANFAGDAEATKTAEGWELVDSKKNIGKDRMLPQNLTRSYFGFSSETTTPYQYYKIVFWGNFKGQSGAVQLQELEFGTTEQFDSIKTVYIDAAKEFDTNKTAYKPYIERYESLVEDSIDQCVNMEVLYRINKQLETLRDTINASEEAYTRYMDLVAENQDFLNENNNPSAGGYKEYNDYLNERVEPNEIYPNGSYDYIMEECMVQDSILDVNETNLINALKAEYVSNAYEAGYDITAMVQNPGFQAMDGWEGTPFYTNGGSTNGTKAAEWCVTDGGKFNVYQTMTDMKPGYYKVNIGAAFRHGRDKYSYDHRAVAYANDAAVIVPIIREYMCDESEAWKGSIADVPVYEGGADPSEETPEEEKPAILGYVAWGVAGSANAFSNGRYRNILVAEVKEDGVLTFGVGSVGTPTNDDWTAVGDVKISYLGTDKNLIDAAVKEAVANATVLKETLDGPYAEALQEAYDIEAFKNTPAYAAANDVALAQGITAGDLAGLDLISGVAKAIPVEKQTYISLYELLNTVVNRWLEHDYDIETKLEDYYNAITVARTYSADDAEAAKEKVVAEYPDYFGIVINSEKNLSYSESAPFEYEIEFSGEGKPFAQFEGLYAPADSARLFILFEYTAPQDLTTVIYYGAPTVGADKDEIPLAATATPKKIAIDVKQPRQSDELMWCSGADHRFEWRFGESAITGSINIYKPLLVTEAEIEGAEVITGIKNVEDAVAPVVEGVYNLSGQRVSKAQKGIYIINGQKVLVK